MCSSMVRCGKNFLQFFAVTEGAKTQVAHAAAGQRPDQGLFGGAEDTAPGEPATAAGLVAAAA